MLSKKALTLAATLGPVVVDIEGTRLSSQDLNRITHPMAGMVILFSRNFESKAQLTQLCAAIHAARPGMIIAVDHEGGRVQRFRDGLTHVPSMDSLRAGGVEKFFAAGFILASELRALGVDLTFAPVLDINYGKSEVIGDRSFGVTVDEVIKNTSSFMAGLKEAGMANCGKHFPGHGWATADSHVALPVDERAFSEIKSDCRIYKQLALQLTSIMTAHIAFDALDGTVATYSEKLLKDFLRDELKFGGLVFSDDLSMKGAQENLSPAQRAQKALNAGCDMVLHCNHPEELDEILDALSGTWTRTEEFNERLARMMPGDFAFKEKELSERSLYKASKIALGVK